MKSLIFVTLSIVLNFAKAVSEDTAILEIKKDYATVLKMKLKKAMAIATKGNS